jgi:hypothetical protein
LKGRPSQLVLSPNDGALKDSAAKTLIIALGDDEDYHGHMSDSEVAPTNLASTSRRFFGRSHESTLSIIHSSARSKASSLPSSIDDDILISIPHYPTHVSHSNKLLKSMAYHWQRRERPDWTAATAPTVYSSQHSLLTHFQINSEKDKPTTSGTRVHHLYIFQIPTIYSSNLFGVTFMIITIHDLYYLSSLLRLRNFASLIIFQP